MGQDRRGRQARGTQLDRPVPERRGLISWGLWGQRGLPGSQAQGTHLLCRLQGEHGGGWAGRASASGPIYTLAQPLGGGSGVLAAGSALPENPLREGARAGGWADCTSLVTWWAGQPWGPSGFGDPHGWRVGG